MKTFLRESVRCVLLVWLIGWRTAGLSFGQAGVPETTPPGGSTTTPGGSTTGPAGSTPPGSSTATGWLRLNGNIGINTSDPKARLHVADGDVLIENIGSGVIMRSPNGRCWRVTVDNAGNFVRQRIPCPGEGPLRPEVLDLQPGPANGQDGYVSSSQSTSIGGGLGMAIGAWTIDGTPTTYRGYLRFDLSSIPNTATIDSAFLTLNFYPGWFTAPNVGNNAAYIQQVTSAWDQASLNYSTRPTSTSVGQIVVPAAESFPGVYQRLNVTSLVSAMVASPTTNYGFMIRLQDESMAPPYRVLLFHTSETTISTNRPRLVVYYSP